MAENSGCKIYIGNLDDKVPERVLYEILIQVGRVVDFHVPRDKESNRPKGYAFAEYESKEIADYAIRLFSGLVTLNNKALKFAISGQNKAEQNNANMKHWPNKLHQNNVNMKHTSLQDDFKENTMNQRRPVEYAYLSTSRTRHQKSWENRPCRELTSQPAYLDTAIPPSEFSGYSCYTRASMDTQSHESKLNSGYGCTYNHVGISAEFGTSGLLRAVGASTGYRLR